MNSINTTSRKKFCSLPISENEYERVKQKQVELISKRGKTVSLAEIADELVKKGLNLIE